MTVYANHELKLRITEALTVPNTNEAQQIIHEIATPKGVLSSATPVVVSKAWSSRVQLSAGALSLDLTALTRTNLPNVDFTGLKVKAMKIVPVAANTAAVTLTVGGTNGYQAFGAIADGKISLAAGSGAEFIFGNAELPAVDASAKTIDLSSSDVDALVDIIIAAGA